MSHTSGPWSARPSSLTSAYIDTPKGGMSIQCSGIPDRGEWEANANLIAAAPDLYEELLLTRSALIDERDDETCDAGNPDGGSSLRCHHCQLSRWIVRINLAIARAEGRS